MNTKIIKLDLNRILYDKIIAKQGDTKSRFLLFQLLDGSIPFYLTNRSVRAYMVKPDGKEIFNDLIINNYSLGYCTLELTNQVLAVPGTVKIELMVTEEDRKLTSSVFELEVIKSINSEKSIVSTNEFTALLNGLSSLSEYDNYKNEIAAARDGEVNLLTKVKKIDEQLEHKAKKTTLYVDDYYIDENTTDTEAFQLCCDDAKENEYTIINLNGNKTYHLDNTIHVKKDTSIFGNGATLKLELGLCNKWAFKINLNDDDSAININPLFTAIIKNLYVIAPTDDETKVYNGFLFCQQIKFTEITFKGIDQCIKATNDYIDRMIVEDVYISNRRDSENYAIHSGKQGDMRVFRRIQQGGSLGKKLKYNTLYIGLAHINVEVSNLVGGIGIDCYSNATFNNIMLSHAGYINIYGANCKLNGIYGTINKNNKRINVYSYKSSPTSAQEKKSSFILENSFFSFIDDFTGTYLYDDISPIYIDNVDKFTVNNCFVGNRYSRLTMLTSQAYIKLSYNSKNLNLDFYNQHTKALNGVSYAPNDKVVFAEKYSTTAIGISSIVDGGEWKAESGTYYYKICSIADFERRFGSDWSAEKSTERTKNSHGSILKININSDVNNILIFRGKSSGVYDKYALLSPNTDILLDNGMFISGIKWNDLDTLQSYKFLPRFWNVSYIGDNITCDTDCSISALSSHVNEYKNFDLFYMPNGIAKKINGSMKSINFI